MAHLKTEGVLVKSVHFQGEPPVDFDPMSSSFSIDLTPLTAYSLNKRKRWEIEANTGVKMLEDVRQFHKNIPDEIVFLKRVNLTTFEWKYLDYVHFPREFLINSLHSIKKSSDEEDPVYKYSKLHTIFGQTYSHFLDQNRKPEKSVSEHPKSDSTIVAYNFIRAPKNYMRLGEQNFVASNYGARWPYYAYEKRKQNWKEFETDIKHAIRNQHNDEWYNDSIENENMEETDGFDQNEISKYYDLYNHIKDDFVFVKRFKKGL
ncbi:hypothetical protein CAEBREN_25122 [Caenorhabditis brenneri]|uniref:Uncharacterized protein n=1 Tax=Caenorhabditis brenneri TaxID=135651 RepID=G0N209_CAEBE|nr:hypothetical protein CAEBREN_25122 [Caenorhabditis brenneri]